MEYKPNVSGVFEYHIRRRRPCLPRRTFALFPAAAEPFAGHPFGAHYIIPHVSSKSLQLLGLVRFRFPSRYPSTGCFLNPLNTLLLLSSALPLGSAEGPSWLRPYIILICSPFHASPGRSHRIQTFSMAVYICGIVSIFVDGATNSLSSHFTPRIAITCPRVLDPQFSCRSCDPSHWLQRASVPPLLFSCSFESH